MNDEKTNGRLPRNFHQTFIPERQYIHAMLRFAAGGREGTYQDISSATGIPTGSFSGKVPAILDYCRGMGLIQLTGEKPSKIKQPILTPFGRAVLREDAHLRERITQWIAHLNLCGALRGAEVWHQTFFKGAQVIGNTFSRQQLEEYLSLVFMNMGVGTIGPMVRMYSDDAAFGMCGALTEGHETISRVSAPIEDEFGFAYAAWLIQLMADHFSSQGQVTVSELEEKTGWATIAGWNMTSIQRALALVERKGGIIVDRHMSPWILQADLIPDRAWSRIYDDLI
jgi:hypothetical protein